MEGRKKIYFLYTQFGQESKISNFLLDANIKKVEELEEYKHNEYIRILYCVEISRKKNEEKFKLFLKDNLNETYYSNISLNALGLLGENDLDTDDFFIFNLKFMDSQDKKENNLEQFVLDPNEQFYIFEKKFEKENDKLVNLYLSFITQVLLKTKQKSDLIIDIFSKLFEKVEKTKYNRFKKVLKYFLKNIELILMKAEYIQNKENIQRKLDILSNIDNIRTKLIKLTGEKDANIDLFLSYYYIHYEKKLFIQFLNNEKYKDSLKITLINHRKIFGDFTSEVINEDLLSEATSLAQLLSLVQLYPNTIEFFKILTNYLIYYKFADFIVKTGKGLNPMLIFKPNINDDIYLLNNYFNDICKKFNEVKDFPIVIKKDFFLKYYQCFEKDEDFKKNLMIIDMLNLYNSNNKDELDKTEIIKMHIKKGIEFLKNNKLKNEDFIEFIESIRDKINQKDKQVLIQYFPNGIEFDENNIIFNENILYDNYKLKEFLGKNYYMETFSIIFLKFCTPRDLTVLKSWKITPKTPEEIITSFMEAIQRIWLDYPENNMYGLEDLISMVFSRGSICTTNYLSILESLEKKIAHEKLMKIYSNILMENFEIKYPLKQHIITFINRHENNKALYLWFKLSICDIVKRDEFLETYLKSEHAVKYDDFVYYPKILSDRIYLFEKLKKYKFIPGIHIYSKYYRDSMEAKNNLKKNIFKNAEKMYINLDKINALLTEFFSENKDDVDMISINIVNFQDSYEKAKEHYEPLKIIHKFWSTFFREKYKERINQLQKQIEEFENTILEEAVNKKNIDKNILAKAKEGKEFIDSIFFMEIYNRIKKAKTEENINKIDEIQLYEESVKEFKNLEKLGKSNDLNSLGANLKEDIINAVYKNENSLKGELEFIKKYFKFGENNQYNYFNLENIKNKIEILVINKSRIEGENNEDFVFVDEIPYMGNRDEMDNIINETKKLSDEILYNSNWNEKLNENKLNKLFFKFYEKIFNIGDKLEQISLREINDDIVSLFKKIFYLETNLGIINDNSLLMQEFIFVINIIDFYKKKEKNNYINIFSTFNKIYTSLNLLDNEPDQNFLDLKILVKTMKEILPEYNTDYVYIEIFLINFEMKIKKIEIVKYLLDKELKSEKYGELFPILDNLFSVELKEKFKFNDTKTENYYQFNSEIFSEINSKCEESKDSLEEMLFFYFESKIMEELIKNKEENKIYINKNKYLNNFIGFLEKKIDKKISLSKIFAIAFVKCFLYKLIMQENDIDDAYDLFNIILKFKENDSILSKCRASIKFYVLKLIIYKNGNFSSFDELNLKKYYLYDSFEKKINLKGKLFGFDFMFIPLKLNTDNKTYNSILNKFFHQKKYFFEDEEIIEQINNNYDILFCLFANFHFSFYYNEDYFKYIEYKKFNESLYPKFKNKFLNMDKNIEGLFSIFVNLKATNAYKEFKCFVYNQILSLLISTRFVISTISSKNKKSIFYNLLFEQEETTNNNQLFFNEYYLKEFNNEINDNRNINCLTYKILNYIILSHIYFGFKLNLIKYNDIANVKELEGLNGKNEKDSFDYLLEKIFITFDFIQKKLLPLLGINNIIIFMNSVFKDLYQELLNFQCGDTEEEIKEKENVIDSIVINIINNYGKSVEEYYEKENEINNSQNQIINNDENNQKEIFDIITEKPDFYNDEKIKYPLLPYFTYSNFTVLKKDFKYQYLYFNKDNSKYPFIRSILTDDPIFKIIEYLPQLNEFINSIHNELNVNYRNQEEINDKKISDIREISNEKIKENIIKFNGFIENNVKFFDQTKKLGLNTKISELINIPGSILNNVYKKIIEIYNKFLLKMKVIDKKIFEKVIIQEAKENDYNINYMLKNRNKISYKEKLDELILLYSKRERKIKDKINVYDGGKIIYNLEMIERKLEEQFIFGKKLFSENQRLFILSSEVIKTEVDIKNKFNNIYKQEQITDNIKNQITKYIEENSEESNLRLFYELFFIFKYLTELVPANFKIKIEDDLIKYFELKKYKFTQIQKAKSKIKNLLNYSLYLFEIAKIEVFNKLTKSIMDKINNADIKIDEKIFDEIENLFEKNDIIKSDIIITAMKKYIWRNIKDKDEDNYLFDLNNLKQKDLWDIDITNKFDDEFKNIVELDKKDKNVVKYLYWKIYNINDENDDGNEFEEQIEDNDNGQFD